MNKDFRIVGNLLLGATSIVTSCTLAIAPSFAATFAKSFAGASSWDFSHTPDQELYTFTDTDTLALAWNGEVNAQADAQAEAQIFEDRGFEAWNVTYSQADGIGKSYLGTAKSQAEAKAYNFSVKSGETFSFNWESFLQLETSIDNPGVEKARALGQISFKIFDQDTNKLLDSFKVLGKLKTDGLADTYTATGSSHFTSSPEAELIQFGGAEELLLSHLTGTYSRQFNRDMNLRFEEVKFTHANVSVPEPTSTLALWGLGALGLGLKKNKLGGNKN